MENDPSVAIDRAGRPEDFGDDQNSFAAELGSCPFGRRSQRAQRDQRETHREIGEIREFD